jgi:diaminopimelate decarboxylase
MLNESIRFQDGELYCDTVRVADIAAQVGTPAYIYSLRRALGNLRRIQTAFVPLNAHIHYSAKANGNLAVLRTLIDAGAGIDAVSAGEIFRALKAGARAEDIVFAGVGKTPEELRYAVEQGVGWFNVENVEELRLLDAIAAERNVSVRVALRLNPNVTARTHRHIATGHGGAKFGLAADVVSQILLTQSRYRNARIEGIHIHIGSQLSDTDATEQAVRSALAMIAPYPDIRTVNIGGGLPVTYRPDEHLPDYAAFAAALAPLLEDYDVILEPGRSIIADAGLLVMRVLYLKDQGDGAFVITDAGMTELIRPALYEAHHEIVPLRQSDGAEIQAHIAGPVCETTDVLARNVTLNGVQPGDLLAALTAGAYGMVMASNYNARLRPPEVVVHEDGETWHIARRRETWDDLVAAEIDSEIARS